MKNLHVVRMVYDFPPPWYGLSPGTYELSKAQSKLGARVTVLCGEWPKQKSYKDDNLTVIRLPLTLPYLSLCATYSPAALLKYLFLKKERKTTIVHGHTFHPFFYHYYRKFVRDKIPYVLHMNVTSAKRSEIHGKKASWRRNLEWNLSIESEKMGCNYADAIICVSESVRQEVLQYYKPQEDRIFVIENGVNTDLFKPSGESKKEELGLNGKKVILFVGRIYKNKNLNLLIQSLLLLPSEYHLLIIGTGIDKEKIRSIAEEFEISDRVIFLGYIPYFNLPDYYRAADVFCLLSTLEGAPKVVLEALASGVPVISSRCFKAGPALNKHIFWLDNNTPEEIAGKIENTVKIGHKVNVEEIKQVFDWSTIADKIANVYEKMM
ncbi:glycosyltransferase family 4 protein [Patescibacteria group bacterium]|nr:glycosyltransferase family 4 protein [Patescibacteria group bacterium]